MKYIIKRNNTLSEYLPSKIIIAINKAMTETIDGIDEEISMGVSNRITDIINNSNNPLNVEDIQDLVEDYLMESNRKDVAKRYIIYRHERGKTRKNNRDIGHLLSDKFISKYKHMESPMDQLGNFVYYRTYSRWLPNEGRREYWWETVRRSVEYNCRLTNCTSKEAEDLYDNIFHLRQFLSGRTFWVGGTRVAYDFPTANFNCAFQIVNKFEAFKDLFYLLMVGAGVGLRILKSDVEQLPKVRTNVKLYHDEYNPTPKSKRVDSTTLQFINNDTVQIIVGDSKSGWVQTLDFYLKILWDNDYKLVTNILINYDFVRPKGESLKTFGGTASGYQSLKNMFVKINRIIQKYSKESDKIKLKTIDCLDIANIIGENVVVGGVRRTAEIMLVDDDDEEVIRAKEDLYENVDGNWVPNTDILHRSMSNNSIYYRTKPTRERLHWLLDKMRYSGEPGWINEVAGKKRRKNTNGTNPCGEILLDANGLCNLTTINVLAFVEDGKLNMGKLFKAQKLSARAAFRMTQIELELPEWNKIQQRDHITGCSLTGWQDMVNATNMNKMDQVEILKSLRAIAKDNIKCYCDELGIKDYPDAVTTVKPEGTLSQLPGVSSGIHYSHSPYFIRRVRINASDPLVKVCEELGYSIHPEVGQDINTCSTKVIEFPCKAPEGRTKYDVSAIEQLENYKMFMEDYVDHNASITVHVRDNEWEQVEQWVWDNWDNVVALTFLSLDDSFYQLMPYEAISKEEYEKMVKEMKSFIPSLLQKYEKQEIELDTGDSDCINNICPIR